MALATLAVTAGRPDKVPDAPLNTPITMAATYVAGGEVEYGRYGNPTWTALEDALGALEGGRCLTFASGLAAVATVLDLVGKEGKVVVPKHAYTGTIMQLADLESRGRLTAEMVDITDTDAVVAACDGAALVWLESPTNPALEVADIPAITKAAHDAGAYVVVDNTFATPLLQRPLEDDVDLVVHSATKYLAGHSDVQMGAIVSIVLAQGEMAADLLSRKTRLWIHATSLGGVESSLERRRRWKAEAATIPEGLVRLSVGIEDVEDLWEDLRAALDGCVG